jgi:dihydropyrimidinase
MRRRSVSASVTRKIIRGGTIVTASDSFPADLLIEGERIAALGDLHDVEGETIDARGCLVLPGCIDSHTHLAQPLGDGFTCDDFDTGTRAAAAGGTTCIIDFVIQQRPDGLQSSLDDWMGRAAPNAHVDFGFHMAVTHWDERTRGDIPRLVDQGVPSFKAFMAPAGVPKVTDDVLLALLRETRDHGALTMVHAENGDAIDYLAAQAREAGRTQPVTHAETRPEWTEAEATSRAIWLAEGVGAPLFVVHVSCRRAADEVARARGRGLAVRAETCTHYLTLSVEDLCRPDHEAVRYICSPPLREDGNQTELWKALREDVLQSVSSDHCPYTDGQKRAGVGDFSLAPPGLAGIQHRLSLLWDRGVRTGRITPSRLVDLTSTSVARTFGLLPRKGTLAPGADADVVVFDPTHRSELSGRTSLMNIDYDLWEGQTVEGSPRLTLSRGDIVFADGQILSPAGRGRFVKRAPCDWSATPG